MRIQIDVPNELGENAFRKLLFIIPEASVSIVSEADDVIRTQNLDIAHIFPIQSSEFPSAFELTAIQILLSRYLAKYGSQKEGMLYVQCSEFKIAPYRSIELFMAIQRNDGDWKIPQGVFSSSATMELPYDDEKFIEAVNRIAKIYPKLTVPYTGTFPENIGMLSLCLYRFTNNVRLLNGLAASGIHLVGQMLECSLSEMRNFKNIGNATLRELERLAGVLKNNESRFYSLVSQLE